MGSDCAKNCTIAAIRNSESSRTLSFAILFIFVSNIVVWNTQRLEHRGLQHSAFESRPGSTVDEPAQPGKLPAAHVRPIVRRWKVTGVTTFLVEARRTRW